MSLGLYFHIPFCVKKCPYCDFYSVAYSEESARNFTDAVLRNIKAYKNDKIVDTIYFGGGTPSLLGVKYYDKIFDSIFSTFKSDNVEISLECNPATVDKNTLRELKNVGFNRISFGVQSLCDNELKSLGRLHNSDEAIKSILEANEAGFNNISTDIMLGIISQDLYSLDNSIKKLSNLPIQHVSAYILKVEEGTPYFKMGVQDKIPDEDATADLYLKAVESLTSYGFSQYEISNFAKKGFECRHNIKYWNCDEYIGIGPSAHSYYNNQRYYTPKDLGVFIQNEIQDKIITDSKPCDYTEYAMLRLRLMAGLDLNYCKLKYNIDIEKLANECEFLKKQGLVNFKNNIVSLTPNGCLISNLIIARLT